MYPISSFSNDVDDKDPTLRKDKKNIKKKPAAAAPAPQTNAAPEPPMPDLYAVPEGYEQALGQYQQALEQPMPDDYGYGADPMNGAYYDPYQGGNDNGYVE